MRLELAAPGRPYDLALVCAISGLAVLMAIMGWNSPLLWALAFLSVFLLPGWALVSALFPGRSANLGRLVGQGSKDSEISLLERFMAAVILSLILFAIGGIALAWSPGRFDEGLVLAEVLVLNVGLSALALYRRFQLPKDEEFVMAWELRKDTRPLGRTEKVVLAIAAAGCVLAVAFGTGMLGGGVAPEPYTEFYITGSDGSLDSLPQTLAAGQNGTVVITFVNNMAKATSYNLTVGVMSGESFLNYSALEWSAVHDLMPGDAYYFEETLLDGWTFEHSLSIRFAGEGTHKVMFILEFEDQVQELWLYVEVT